MCEKLNKIVLLLFVLFSTFQYSSAQSNFNNTPGPGPGNGGNVAGKHKLIEDIDPLTSLIPSGDQIRVRFTVSMVNLEAVCYGPWSYEECPEHRRRVAYPMEKEYPDLYVQYRIGEYVSEELRIHLRDFTSTLNQHHLHDGNSSHQGHEVWTAEVISGTFDPNCVDDTFISFELLTKTEEGEFIYYPVHELNGDGDIFDASIFEHENTEAVCFSDGESPCPAISTAEIPLCLDAGERSQGESVLAKYTRLKVGPNPFTNEINYTIGSNKDDQVEVSLLDLQGRVLFSKKKEISTGVNYEHLHLHTLPSGVYFLKIQSNSYSESIKLIKR